MRRQALQKRIPVIPVAHLIEMPVKFLVILQYLVRLLPLHVHFPDGNILAQHIQIFLRQKVTCHDCQLGLHNAAQMPHLLDQFQINVRHIGAFLRSYMHELPLRKRKYRLPVRRAAHPELPAQIIFQQLLPRFQMYVYDIVYEHPRHVIPRGLALLPLHDGKHRSPPVLSACISALLWHDEQYFSGTTKARQ